MRPHRSHHAMTCTIPGTNTAHATALPPTTPPTDTDLPTLATVRPGLYRHYKGGHYHVLHTVRCSETLQAMVVYRALYGEQGLWVRPARMWSEAVPVATGTQPRFQWVDEPLLVASDLATARAVVTWLQHQLPAAPGLRPPPPEPTTCCGRGCNGCVWEGYYEALHHWRCDARALLPR